MTEVKLEKMGRMKREIIFWIAVTLFFTVKGQDVLFEYDGCYSDGITMTAVYTGSGTVTGVEWYYSGKTGSNLVVAVATCSVAGPIPAGYPAANQMNFQCPPALDPNTFKLTVTGLEGEDLKNSWGATFSLSSGSSPTVADSSFSVCATTVSDCGCKSLNNCDISKGGCICLWIFIGLVIVGAGITGICLILHYCFHVKIPCCCKRKKESTEGEPPGTQNGEGQNLHNQYT